VSCNASLTTHHSPLTTAFTVTASLVVQTSFLGDMVLTTPLVAELARRGPVDVVATPANAALLANNPDVRALFVYDKRGEARGLGGMLRLARRLRAERYDAAYLAQGSVRSAALAMAAGIGERVGFDTSAGRALYTRRIPYPADRHHAERLWRLAARDGHAPSAEQLRPRLHPGADEEAAADAVLAPLAGAPFVALAPGSVWATKRWPYYAELAARLSTRIAVVVTGGPGDGELAAAIVAECGHGRALDATGRLSLLASAALIGRAEALVTNDSAPQHLASAMATPTLTIFGPTVPDFGFGPLAAGSLTAGHQALACRPCDPHGPARCPLGHWRCMREQPPERIAELVDLLPPRPPRT
jgi:heptosyltransferase-2